MAATNYLNVVVRVEGKATQVEPVFFDDTDREATQRAIDDAREIARGLQRHGRAVSIVAWRRLRGLGNVGIASVLEGP